jgi:hypothetical protein
VCKVYEPMWILWSVVRLKCPLVVCIVHNIYYICMYKDKCNVHFIINTKKIFIREVRYYRL